MLNFPILANGDSEWSVVNTEFPNRGQEQHEFRIIRMVDKLEAQGVDPENIQRTVESFRAVFEAGINGLTNKSIINTYWDLDRFLPLKKSLVARNESVAGDSPEETNFYFKRDCVIKSYVSHTGSHV